MPATVRCSRRRKYKTTCRRPVTTVTELQGRKRQRESHKSGTRAQLPLFELSVRHFSYAKVTELTSVAAWIRIADLRSAACAKQFHVPRYSSLRDRRSGGRGCVCRSDRTVASRGLRRGPLRSRSPCASAPVPSVPRPRSARSVLGGTGLPAF